VEPVLSVLVVVVVVVVGRRYHNNGVFVGQFLHCRLHRKHDASALNFIEPLFLIFWTPDLNAP
jgi:hypothetical protein